MKGTINDPPPIPKGTDINPITIPVVFFTTSEIVLGLFIKFSLRKIKNKPTRKAKKAKNKTKAGVLRLTARNVPAITPQSIKRPNDLTILKSTALYSE